MPTTYKSLYQKSPFEPKTYRAPRERKSWYDMSYAERLGELQKTKTQLTELPEIPETRFGFREAFKPVLNVLQIVTGILNVPSAAISSAVKQFVDGRPGFDAREYYRDVFNLREQNSWSDIISILAIKDKDKNIWDKKWMQLTAGILLDIVLDPLTYFGVGVADDLMKRGTEIRKIAQVGLELSEATPVANRVYKNIINRSFQRVWGFKLPWAATVKKPIQLKAGRELKQIVSKGAYDIFATQAPVLKTEIARQVAEKALPFAKRPTPIQAFTVFLERNLPGFLQVEQMFVPSKKALIPVIESKLKMMHNVGANTDDLQREIINMIKGKDYKTLRKILEVAEDPPYIDGDIVRLTRRKAFLMADFIKRYSKSEKGWQEIAQKMAENNDDYVDFLTDGVKKLLTNYENRKILKKLGYSVKLTPKPTAEQIAKESGEILDTMTARQMRALLEKSGINVGDLTIFARYKPQVDKEKIFKALGKKLSPEQKNSVIGMIDTARDMMDNWWDLERAAELPENYITDYFTRITGAARRLGRPTELGGVPAFTFERISDIPITKRFDIAKKQLVRTGFARNERHAERLLRTGAVDAYGRIFDTIQEALYIRGVAHIKAMHKLEFINEVKRWGKKVEEKVLAPMGWQEVGNVPELAGYFFDSDTAKYINRTINVLGNDRGIKAFLRMIDKTQNWWKALVLFTPGFHMRNMYSNHFIGWIRHGLRYFNPKVHKDGLAMTLEVLYPNQPAVWKMFGVNKSRLNNKYLGKTLKELADEIKQYGVIRKSVRITELPIEKGIPRGAKAKALRLIKKLNILNKDNVIKDVLDSFGGLIESQARSTNFLLEYRNMGDINLAARKTQEIYVDYSNLTSFEREIGRRVIPFWSWFKQNTANQIKFIFTQPARYANIGRVSRTIENLSGERIPEEERPEYFRELWMWQLPLTLPDGKPLFFNPNFPFQDLNKLDVTEWKRTLLSQITPFIKVPMELMTGYDIFRKAPIERYPGYRAPVPGILQNIANVLPGDVRTALDLRKDDRGVWVMNPMLAHAITNLVPFINNTARMLMLKETPIPADKYFQWASAVLGIKVKPIDPLTQQYYRTLEAIRRRKKQLARAGYGI